MVIVFSYVVFSIETLDKNLLPSLIFIPALSIFSISFSLAKATKPVSSFIQPTLVDWGTHVVEFCGCQEVGTLAEKVLFMEKVARRQSVETGRVVLLLFISGGV